MSSYNELLCIRLYILPPIHISRLFNGVFLLSNLAIHKSREAFCVAKITYTRQNLSQINQCNGVTAVRLYQLQNKCIRSFVLWLKRMCGNTIVYNASLGWLESRYRIQITQREKLNIFLSSLICTPSGTQGVSKDAPLSTELGFGDLVL